MRKGITLTIEGKTVRASLNDSTTADLFYNKLPVTIELSRWGDEYYGDCGLEVEPEAGARADMEVGELAIWPQGSALCIFFGPTPASTGGAPRAVSPVNPIGRIEGDALFLKKLGGSVTVEVKKIE
jgi:uncharacterized protein